MSNYRRRNFQLDVPPPGPVPSTPKITKVTPGDTTATVEWQYPANEVDVDHWDLYVYEGSGLLGIVRVEGPATRTHTLGELANGVAYSVELQAVNLNGHSPSSNRVTFTPEELKIPAPTILSVAGKDGYISYTYKEGENLPGKVIGHRYVVKRVDVEYETTGDAIEDKAGAGHTGPVDNDRTYRLYLATVIEGGKSGPYSQASEPVTPTEPRVPYKPRWTHVDANPWSYDDGRGRGCDWLLRMAKGLGDSQLEGGLDITSYRYTIVEKATGKLIKQQTIPTSQAETGISDAGPWVEGWCVLSLWTRNAVGESEPDIFEIDVEQATEYPIDFGLPVEVDGYRYHYAYEDVSSYAKVNPKGVGLVFEVLCIGGGGAGHGRTTLGGYGGHGGSAQYAKYTKSFSGTGLIRATVGNGAKSNDTVPGTVSNVTGPNLNVSASGGGTSTGKDNGTPDYVPAPKALNEVIGSDTGWHKIPPFSWDTPKSYTVGGYVEWDKATQPNAKVYGVAGGGTNGSGSLTGGNGADGVIVIRYKISEVPKDDPELSLRQRLRWWRTRRAVERQARRTRANSS